MLEATVGRKAFIYPFIPLVCERFLSSYYVPNTFLGPECYGEQNKQNSCSDKWCIRIWDVAYTSVSSSVQFVSVVSDTLWLRGVHLIINKTRMTLAGSKFKEGNETGYRGGESLGLFRQASQGRLLWGGVFQVCFEGWEGLFWTRVCHFSYVVGD